MQTLVMEGSNREEVSFDQLPDDLVNAFIAIEDSRFYEHNGIDLKGILRAAYVGITSGRFLKVPAQSPSSSLKIMCCRRLRDKHG